MKPRALLALIGFLASSPELFASQDDARGIEFFETKIRPVLVRSCYECHSTTTKLPSAIPSWL